MVASWSLEDASRWFAYLFNRTVLGFGVLVGLYWLWQGVYWKTAVVIVVFMPLYFFLHDRLDAP